MRYLTLLSVSALAAFSSPTCLGGTFVLAEDADSTISADFACHPGGMAPGGTAPQSFYRAFKLSSFLDPSTSTFFELDSVNFPVGIASSSSGTGQPLNVNLYTTSAIPPTVASMTLIRNTAMTIPDESVVFATATFASPPVFNVGSDTVVVEIAVPEGRINNNSFDVGFNDGSQTAPSYYMASACDANEPTDTDFFDVHIPITVSGQSRSTTPVTLQSFFVD